MSLCRTIARRSTSLGLSRALVTSLLVINADTVNAEELSFGYVRGVPFTTAIAAARVNYLNALVAEGAGQGPSNTPCTGLKYTLAGPPKEYDSSFPTSISGPRDVAKFRTSPNKIHVVQRINYCEGSGSTDGCTFPGGPIFITKSA